MHEYSRSLIELSDPESPESHSVPESLRRVGVCAEHVSERIGKIYRSSLSSNYGSPAHRFGPFIGRI